MKQKYLIFIAVGILFILIVVLSLLNRLSFTNSTTSTVQYVSITPINQSSRSNQNIPSIHSNNTSRSQSNSSKSNKEIELSQNSKRQYLVTPIPTPTKSPISSFTSSLNYLYGNPNNQKPIGNNPKPSTNKSTIKIETSPTPTPDPVRNFIDALNILFSSSNTNPVITNQSPNQPEDQTKNKTPVNTLGEKVYYPQCNGPYDNGPLPNGCDICAAGCGPTSVAMILSSYIDKKYDPPNTVNLYKESGLEAGCKGTTILSAQQILNQNGLKTTDVIYYGNSSFDETVQDFKQYLNSGWTLLTLVKYAKDWGHFYWVVDVDENNNIWAYDPGDAKRPVPLNENTVEPTAKYYLAIGVKK